MKLYTEEQVRKAMEKILSTYGLYGKKDTITFDLIIDEINPIQLPTNEELSEEGHKQWGNVHSVGLVGWLDGAKQMRDKIQGGNK